MSIQYRDDSFSENMPLPEALKRLHQELENDEPIKAFHIGTNDELNNIKNKIKNPPFDLSEMINDLSDRINALESAQPTIKSSIIDLPNHDEIQKFGVQK